MFTLTTAAELQKSKTKFCTFLMILKKKIGADGKDQ